MMDTEFATKQLKVLLEYRHQFFDIAYVFYNRFLTLEYLIENKVLREYVIFNRGDYTNQNYTNGS